MHAVSSSPAFPGLPARFVAPDAATERRFGPRLPRLGRFLLETDPLADAAAAALAALPAERREPMIEAALRRGIEAVPDAPPALRALFAQLDRVPLWWDAKRGERGGAAFLASGWFGGAVLALRSLILGYCSPAGNKPLAFSGRLREDAGRRLGETSRFVQAVSLRGGMDRFGDGFAITVRVRLMHAKVRLLLQDSKRWSSAWGEPINQLDMAGTILLFSSVVLDGLRAFGVGPTASASEDLIHLWRYVGHVIGVDAELLVGTEAEAQELWLMIGSTQAPPDDDSRGLAQALLENPLQVARTKEERSRARGMVRLSYALSRYLVGDELANGLGYPKAPMNLALPAIRRIFETLQGGVRRVPFGETWLEARGRRHWENVVALTLRGKPATFPMPEVLAARGSAAKSQGR